MSTALARSPLILVAGLAGLALGTHALAQPAPLSGPTVTENRPGFDDRFSGSGEGGKFARKDPMGLRPVPLRAYVGVVMKLRGDAAPADLRLSKDQEDKINGIVDDFRAGMRQHLQQRRPGDPAATPAQPVDTPAGQPDEKQRRKGQGNGGLREQLREAAPLMADCETRIYATLTPPQQKFVDGEVGKIREEMEHRAGEEYMKRHVAKRGKGGRAGEPGSPPPPEEAQRERAQRVLARLREMTPEQREEILSLLERELDKRGVPDAEPRRDGGDKDESKPAPSMDQVPVPAPKKSR